MALGRATRRRGAGVADVGPGCLKALDTFRGAATEETTLADRLLASLERVAPQGLSTRELCQLLHRSSQEVRTALELLQEAGHVSNEQSGRKLIWARSATDEQSVASVAKRSTSVATPVSPVLTPETPQGQQV